MKQVLVVDDSKAIRMAIRRILESLTLSVVEAADGQQALDYLAGHVRPDCVLLDIDMPVMDGIACLKSLRATPALAGLPVVMCTANGTMAKISEALSCGADEYIMKPFDVDIVKSKLEMVHLL